MTRGGQLALWLVGAATVAMEVWVSIHLRDDPSVIFGNLAVFLYALLAAALVVVADLAYRVIRWPPHRRPPRH